MGERGLLHVRRGRGLGLQQERCTSGRCGPHPRRRLRQSGRPGIVARCAGELGHSRHSMEAGDGLITLVAWQEASFGVIYCRSAEPYRECLTVLH